MYLCLVNAPTKNGTYGFDSQQVHHFHGQQYTVAQGHKLHESVTNLGRD